MRYRCALVVDGARSARLRAVTLLRLAGFRVHEAAGVSEGLAQAARHQPVLVVADAVLPDGDGLDFLLELRRRGLRAQFLVVALAPTARLCRRAFRGTWGVPTGAASRASDLAAAAFSVLYAMSDEYHQTFVGGRSGAWSDVGIDTAGVILAILGTRLAAYLRPK